MTLAAHRELHKTLADAGYTVVSVECGTNHYRLRLRCADGFEFFTLQSRTAKQTSNPRHLKNSVCIAKRRERQDREKISKRQ